MIVVGGCYQEYCRFPHWNNIWGSGARAAAALSWLSPTTSLYTYAYKGWAHDVRAAMNSFNVEAHITEIDKEICFDYFHPMNKFPPPKVNKQYSPLKVHGKTVVSFGFIEGSAIIEADCAVFDPQTAQPSGFRRGGSHASHLAIVLRDSDLESYRAARNLPHLVDAANEILTMQGAEVLVARDALCGAAVYEGQSQPTFVDPCESQSWFKIGVGDVFCAIFAHYWAENRVGPVDAAKAAARSVAYYAEGHKIPIPSVDALLPRHQLKKEASGQVLLASPFHSMSERWLAEEAYQLLTALGANVVALDDPQVVDNSPSTRTLNEFSATLAILDTSDPDPAFVAGRLRATGRPVVVLAEKLSAPAQNWLRDCGCEVASDFASAIYRTIATLKRQSV